MNNIIGAADKYRQLMLDTADYIWKNPETGYKEVKTSKYMSELFEKLGYKLNYADNITGFYTVIDTGRPGPEILILAELDSIICPEHKDADPVTGAVHSCGHHAQCAALAGIAAVLAEPCALDKMCGRIRLCAVPAEELLEIEYRTELKKQGKIKYFGGKTEFLSRGYFDGVDIAFMIHTSYNFAVNTGSVGCLAKKIIYKGKAAHAGGQPWAGINALYAATCGINAANALRETFREEDLIRFHPIITSAGSMVNAIPSSATLESYVRGVDFDAIITTNKKINRALCGAALSVGANIEINDIPGYAPLKNDVNMIKLFEEAAAIAIPGQKPDIRNKIKSGSTDMGDLSCIMPVVHPYSGGARGTSHGSDYYIENPEDAYVSSAKVQLCMLHLLLCDNGKRALQIKQEFKPLFASAAEYLEYVDSLSSDGERIVYSDNNATINW